MTTPGSGSGNANSTIATADAEDKQGKDFPPVLEEGMAWENFITETCRRTELPSLRDSQEALGNLGQKMIEYGFWAWSSEVVFAESRLRRCILDTDT